MQIDMNIFFFFFMHENKLKGVLENGFRNIYSLGPRFRSSFLIRLFKREMGKIIRSRTVTIYI